MSKTTIKIVFEKSKIVNIIGILAFIFVIAGIYLYYNPNVMSKFNLTPINQSVGTWKVLAGIFGSSIIIIVVAIIIAIIAQLAIIWFVIGLVMLLIFGSSLLLPLLLGH